MRKKLRYIMSSIFMLMICFVLVGCKIHENKSYLVDGEEIIGDEIDHIPNNITFKKNASVGSTVKINASVVPSTAVGKIYVSLSNHSNLTAAQKEVREMYYLKSQSNSILSVSYSSARSFTLTYKKISNNPYYLLFFSENNGTCTDLLASCKIDFEKHADQYFSLGVQDSDYVDDDDYEYSNGENIYISEYFSKVDVFFSGTQIGSYIYSRGTVGNNVAVSSRKYEMCLTDAFCDYLDDQGIRFGASPEVYVDMIDQDWNFIDQFFMFDDGWTDAVISFSKKNNNTPFLRLKESFTYTSGYNKPYTSQSIIGICY